MITATIHHCCHVVMDVLGQSECRAQHGVCVQSGLGLRPVTYVADGERCNVDQGRVINSGRVAKNSLNEGKGKRQSGKGAVVGGLSARSQSVLLTFRWPSVFPSSSGPWCDSDFPPRTLRPCRALTGPGPPEPCLSIDQVNLSLALARARARSLSRSRARSL